VWGRDPLTAVSPRTGRRLGQDNPAAITRAVPIA